MTTTTFDTTKYDFDPNQTFSQEESRKMHRARSTFSDVPLWLRDGINYAYDQTFGRLVGWWETTARNMATERTKRRYKAHLAAVARQKAKDEAKRLKALKKEQIAAMQRK